MPDDVIDGEELDGGSPDPVLQEMFKKHGVSSIEELDEKIRHLDKRNKAFATLRNEKEELEERLRSFTEKQEDVDYGVPDNTDPTVKNILRTVKKLEMRILRTAEDDELDEYLAEARTSHPNLMKIPDPEARLEAYRAIARGLRAEKDLSATTESARIRGERKALSSSRAYVERGGGGQGGGRQSSEEDDLKRFESEYSKADTDGKRQAVMTKYRRLYPDWGL